MALERSARPLAQSLRCTRHERISQPIRTFSSETTEQLNPSTVSTPRLERKVQRETGTMPVGSRRRRRALASSANIPFEQLPYQCFQEARKFLQEDRQQKLDMIKRYRARIDHLLRTTPGTDAEVMQREARLRDMGSKLEATKILADINDPIVKKRFEDGFGVFFFLSSSPATALGTGTD